jgi:replicative DNA helicase
VTDDDDTIPAAPGRTPDVLAAEQAVLGTVLSSRTAAENVTAILGEDSFAEAHHRAVYAAVRRVLESLAPGKPLDPPSVLAHLVAAEQGVWRTGQAGIILAGLMERATPSYLAHACTILNAARQRAVLEALVSARQIASEPGFDADERTDQIRKLLDDAAGTGVRSDRLRTQAEIFDAVVDRLESGTEPGLRTGYADLDDATGGLRPGTLTVIGARPGVGKSVLGGCIADHVAGRLGLPVLFASLEMTAEELMHRRIAARARVPLDAITKGTLTERDWDRIAAAREYITDSPLAVDDEPGVPLSRVVARMREMERDGAAPRLLVIDYLGLLKEPKSESRQVAVAAMARECKNIARRYKLPVLLLVQVKREAEHRQGKVPLMSDLRESGEIEAAADVILLLHREDMYERESPRAGEVDVHLSKNRQGPQCVITMQFQGHYGRIVGMTREDQDPGEWSPSTVVAGGAA